MNRRPIRTDGRASLWWALAGASFGLLLLALAVVLLGRPPADRRAAGGSADAVAEETGSTGTGAAASESPGAAAGSGAAEGPESGLAVGSAGAGSPESVPEVPAGGWASPTESSPLEFDPVPAEDRVPKPEAVHGLYAGSWSTGDPARFNRLIALAEATEINAFVIDVKNVTGHVTYPSQVPLARQVGATDSVRIPDLRARLDRLREEGIYPIARIVAFKDPLLAKARPGWSIRRKDGSIWEDNNGVRWVDSFNRNVWDYNIELAREVIALGFSEIQWDYIRFPDAPNEYLQNAVNPARNGRLKSDGIREFMIYAQDRLADLDVPVTADVFGITTSAHTDVGIGQLWEKMADVMDVLLPMVYPSHYPSGSWGYENPNAAPYQIVKRALDDGVARSASIENAATIRPWLQAFSLGEPEYTPRYIRAQIDAVYDAGLSEWILWNPSVRYSAEPLATADGRDPWFAGLGATLYPPAPPELDTLEVGPAVEHVEPPGLTIGGGVQPEG